MGVADGVECKLQDSHEGLEVYVVASMAVRAYGKEASYDDDEEVGNDGTAEDMFEFEETKLELMNMLRKWIADDTANGDMMLEASSMAEVATREEDIEDSDVLGGWGIALAAAAAVVEVVEEEEEVLAYQLMT